MSSSILFQIAGSLCVFVGYWLNSKNHPRQHQLFILGHIFLIAFAAIELKWVLVALSVFVIYMQFKISKRKYKFKKDIVRVKKITRKIKPKRHENKGVPKKDHQVGGSGHKKGHIV